jgi:hypothetical protein
VGEQVPGEARWKRLADRMCGQPTETCQPLPANLSNEGTSYWAV